MGHREEVEQYVTDVLAGRIVTGRLARLAVWRYVDDLENAEARGFHFDESKACDFLDFTESVVKHTQGEWAGQPFEMEPWQKFCDWNLFGWRRVDGTRRFRKDYEEIARKNGKTTRCGPKCFYLSMLDDPIENGGQGYCAATKEDQAKLLFDELKRMIGVSPSLAKVCKCFHKRIVFPSTQSYMQLLGSDSNSQDGFNPHFVIRDELHAWQERHRKLKEKLETGFGSRRQPLTVTITTAGDDQSTLWSEEHDYAVAVLESVITGNIVDDSYFAFICAIDHQPLPCFRCLGDNCPWCGGSGTIAADDPFDEACWIKANPNLGVSVKLDRLREAANEAKHKPTALNSFLRYHCNVRVSSSERLILPEQWAACRGELGDWKEADIHGGFDLGRSNDFAAATLVASFPMTDDNGEAFTRYEVRSRSWTCRERAEDVQTAQVAAWVSADEIGECYGNQVSFAEVEEWVRQMTLTYGVRTWAYDPTNAAQMGQRLAEEFGDEFSFPLPQNAFRYNEPTRTFQRLVTEVRTVDGQPVRAFVHDGDPVLGWQVCNLIVRKNNKDEWMPDKGASPFKIDAAVALLMGLSEAMFAEKNLTWKPESIRL